MLQDLQEMSALRAWGAWEDLVLQEMSTPKPMMLQGLQEMSALKAWEFLGGLNFNLRTWLDLDIRREEEIQT